MRKRLFASGLALSLASACGGAFTHDTGATGASTPTPDAAAAGLDSGTMVTGSDSAAETGAPATCSSGDVTTAGVQGSYPYSGFNSSPSVNATSTVAWSCSSTTRSMTGNGLPDHDVGTFPNANCPNTIAAWAPSADVTLTPTDTGTATAVGIVGFALNGVKFDPGTAGTCTVSGG